MAYSASQLLSMSQQELDNLFSSSPSGDHPQWRGTGNGDYRSRHKVQRRDCVADQYLCLEGEDL